MLKVLALFSAAAITSGQTGPIVSFDTPRVFPGVETSIIVADLNGDGKLDIAVANSGGLSVYLGNGRGMVGPPTLYPLNSPGLPAVLAADFNQDGKPDLALVGRHGASIFLGNGDGTFQNPHFAFAGGDVSGMAAGDLNGDGKTDLVFTHADYGTISVLLGKGDGTFETGVVFPAGSRPVSVAVGDFNGDGKPDVVVADIGKSPAQGSVSILPGTGTGAFQQPASFGKGSFVSLLVGDFNGDGKLDVAAVKLTHVEQHSVVSIMLGNGNGTLQRARDIPFETPSFHLVAGDFNGDGKPDLAVDNGAILLGKGDGSFRLAPEPFEPGGSALAAADLTGDGKEDLLVCSNGIYLLTGRGDGTFLRNDPLSLPYDPINAAVGDFNGDGNPDLAITNTNAVLIVLGDGHGGFTTPVSVNAGYGACGVATGDFNGDGKLDLAVTNYNVFVNPPGDTISILLGNGDGSFQPPVSYQVPSPPEFVGVADLNGDGHPDVIVVSGNGTSVLSILLGNGDGTFQTAQNYLDGETNAVAVGDFNGDGKPDLAVAVCANNTGGVSMMLGNGDGTFQAPVLYATPLCPAAVAVGDLNGDGKLDVVAPSVQGKFAAATYSLLGNGDGTLQAPVISNLGAFSPVLADFNGDGKLDLAFFGQFFEVAAGNGDGTFQAPDFFATQAPGTLFGLPYGSLALSVGDFNHDGKPDIAAPYVGSQHQGEMTILLNTTR